MMRGSLDTKAQSRRLDYGVLSAAGDSGWKRPVSDYTSVTSGMWVGFQFMMCISCVWFGEDMYCFQVIYEAPVLQASMQKQNPASLAQFMPGNFYI